MVGLGRAAHPGRVAAAQGEGHVGLLERDGGALQQVADLVPFRWLHGGPATRDRPVARTGAVERPRAGHRALRAHRDLQHPARALPGRRPGRRRPAGRRRQEPGRRRARPPGGRPRPAALLRRRPDRGGRRGDGRRRSTSSSPRSPARPGGTWMAATGEEQPGSATYGIALLSRYPVVSWRVVRLPPLRASVPMWFAGLPPPFLARDEPRVAVAAVLDGPFGAVHRLQHAPVVHPRVERTAAAPAGALADRARGSRSSLIGDLNMERRQATQVSGLRPIATAATFPADAPAPAARPRARARRPARHRAGGGGAAAAVGPPRARRPLRTGLTVTPTTRGPARRWATMPGMASNGRSPRLLARRHDRAGGVLGDRRA